MIRGLTVSCALHAGLLVWALVNFQETKPLKPAEPEPVEVALVTPDELVRLRQGDRNAKQLEAAPEPAPSPDVSKLEAPKPKPPPPPPPPPEASAPPPPPEPAKQPDVPPPPAHKDTIADKLAALPPEPKGPSPEELQQIEAEKKAEAERAAEAERKRQEAAKKKLEQQKAAEAKRKADAEKKRKEAEAKKKFDADRIAALLDKTPDKRGAPPAAAANPAPAAKAKGPTAGAPEGHDTQLTASERSMIGVMMRRAVSRCWNINAGAEGIDKMVVKVEVMLTPEGRLAGTPKVVNSAPGPLFVDAANSAVRALVQCEPYDLPAKLYDGGWDHMIVTFDPQSMFR